MIGDSGSNKYHWLHLIEHKAVTRLDYRKYSALTPASLCTHTNTGAQPPQLNSPVVLICLGHQSQVDPTHTLPLRRAALFLLVFSCSFPSSAWDWTFPSERLSRSKPRPLSRLSLLMSTSVLPPCSRSCHLCHSGLSYIIHVKQTDMSASLKGRPVPRLQPFGEVGSQSAVT